MNLWTTTYIEKFKKTPYLQHNEKELHITVKKDIFVPMEPVEIIVSMRNTALETRKFMPSGWLSYTGHCMKGEKMPQPIKEINGLPLSPLFANPTCFAEPNQIFWNNTSTLNKKNDITLEGEYHIQMFHLDCYNFINHSAQIKQKDNNELPKNTSTFQSIDQKFKVEWIKSNIITIKVDSTLIDLSKVISPDLQRTYTKPSHGVSFSFVSDKLRYDNYGPVYFRIATKNVSSESVSMIVDTKNVLDVYELVLLTPGDNL
ncbi:MAG: hypothetical protein LBP59_06700, partial [Planctomycetaceae bacterium]|nr:hypothetical protein [Planctomycetaceae bacterium]